MILETARLHIVPGREAEFEAAFAEARKVLASAGGHRSHELLRSHEQPGLYLLLVRWDSIEDHTEGFRGSALFQQWRALLQPCFASPPEVGHYLAADAALQRQ